MTEARHDAPAMDADIIHLARTYAFDFYIAATLAPAAPRKRMLPVVAYTGALDEIVATTSEAALGRIRLQWWRDEMEKIATGAPGDHPLARSLGPVINECGLPPALFLALADARDDILTGDGFPDTHSLNVHLAKRFGTLFRLSAGALLGRDRGVSQDLCERAGISYGIAHLLFTARDERWLPRDRLASQSATGVRAELASDALVALDELRSSTRQCPKPARPAFLPLRPAELLIKEAARNHTDGPGLTLKRLVTMFIARTLHS